MKHFFYPSSIAVFGVSPKPSNLAKNIIHNCMEMGYSGRILPLGKNPGRVSGKEIITDPEQLPEGIDLAVILVPSHLVGHSLEICGQKGIRNAVVSTGGYREFNDSDNHDETALVETAKRYGIRFVGPNCIGIINTASGLCTPFNPINTKNYKTGTVSIIAQSGGVANQVAHTFSDEHIGFSKIMSIGNKLDLNEIDFIRYLMDDPDTRQIHLYLESIDNGRQLMQMAGECTKPIVILKSNVTRTASEVAKSHTAALSNNDGIVQGALKQAGIIRVNTIHELTVCAKALRLPQLKGNRLLAISLSGGFSVILGDACEKHGFVCPPLPQSLIQEIESFRRGGVIRMTNPMDFGDIHTMDALIFAIKACLSLDTIDGMVLSIMYGPEIARMFGKEMARLDKLLDIFARISLETGKPIGLSFFAEKRYIEQLKAVDTFPVFNDPQESVLAMKMLRDYSCRGTVAKKDEIKHNSKVLSHEKQGTDKLMETIRTEGRSVFSEYESKLFLASYHIPVSREIPVESEAGLIEAAETIGYPVVLKGCSINISHKTEKNLLAVDIRNGDEALTAFRTISARMPEPENTVLVQEMVRGKRELAAGLINDPHFGPCVMLGLGGIFAEALHDVVFRVAPLDAHDVMEMISEIKGHKMFDAVRGMEALDTKALTDILVTLGAIGLENENIMEIDINPLIISGNKPVAVDALIVLKSPNGQAR